MKMKNYLNNKFRNVKFYGPEDDENDGVYSTDESTSVVIDDED